MEEIKNEELPVIQEDDLAAAQIKKEPKESRDVNTIAGAIVFAGLMIAGSILYTGKASSDVKIPVPPTEASPKIDFRPVDQTDHILGSSNAPVQIVEYSDLECPFCKQFHATLKEAMKEYGTSGKLAWVYRHFPLNIHPKAAKEAEATECAAEQGGNLMFWKFADRIFEITPSNNGLDPEELTNTARYLNLDLDSFKHCLDSGRYTKKIKDSINEAIAAGANGTPYSLLVINGKVEPMKGGAMPYSSLKQIIDAALNQ